MKTKMLLILILTSKLIYGQNNSILLKEQVLPLENMDSLSSQVYSLLKNYRLIMIGEIHGTNEPVKLLDEIVSLLTKQGDSVLVGFEIPANQMTYFIKHRTDKSILKTEFFSNPSGDGRASIAWYKTIANMNKNKKVQIFFFDINADQNIDADSAMYLNVKSKIKDHPNWKAITIGGGLHNRISTYKGQKKMGNHLLIDKELNLTESLCSLNHEFESGETLWNEFKPIPSMYSKISLEKYLYINPNGLNEEYNGVFFTRYLTKSESAVVK